MANQHFNHDALRFLVDLQLNNRRDWFDENRQNYEDSVRTPALQFVRDIEPALHKISPHFVASDKKAGGSLLRIHRDVRFSKDKTPYKTNIGLFFRHKDAKDIHAPGFYLHIDVDEAFIGAGSWHPPGPALKAVRAAIDADADAWNAAAHTGPFAKTFELSGDSLKRAPKGYAIDHPQIVDLRRKDFVAVTNFEPSAIADPGFIDFVADTFAVASPFMRYLCDAMGADY